MKMNPSCTRYRIRKSMIKKVKNMEIKIVEKNRRCNQTNKPYHQGDTIDDTLLAKTTTDTINTEIGMITFDEGDDFYVRAYRVSLSDKGVDDGKYSGTFGGPFEFVVIEDHHPNAGYYADAGFFYRSMHLKEWQIVPIASWMEKYQTIEQFLGDYPIFNDLFKSEKESLIRDSSL